MRRKTVMRRRTTTRRRVARNTHRGWTLLESAAGIGCFFNGHQNPPIVFNVCKLASLAPVAGNAAKVGDTTVEMVAIPFGVLKTTRLPVTTAMNEKVNAHNVALRLVGTNGLELLQEVRLQNTNMTAAPGRIECLVLGEQTPWLREPAVRHGLGCKRNDGVTHGFDL